MCVPTSEADVCTSVEVDEDLIMEAEEEAHKENPNTPPKKGAGNMQVDTIQETKDPSGENKKPGGGDPAKRPGDNPAQNPVENKQGTQSVKDKPVGGKPGKKPVDDKQEPKAVKNKPVGSDQGKPPAIPTSTGPTIRRCTPELCPPGSVVVHAPASKPLPSGPTLWSELSVLQKDWPQEQVVIEVFPLEGAGGQTIKPQVVPRSDCILAPEDDPRVQKIHDILVRLLAGHV